MSQVKLDVNTTGKHQRAIDRAKGVKQTAEEKKVEAEQIKKQVEARKQYKKQYDSLKTIHLRKIKFDTLRVDSLTMSLDSLSDSLDSLAVPSISKEDSLAIAEAILSQPEFQQLEELLKETIPIEKPEDLQNADSIALAKATAILEEHAQSYLPTELNQSGNPLDGLPSNPLEGGVPDLSQGIPEIEKPSRPNPNLIKPEQAQELFKKIDPKQFQDIQENIKGLKEKYRELPDTRFPEEGIKRNSLEDVPFKKRLNFGGNVGIKSTDPFILDTNIQLGYWFNKKWLSGVGFILREQFGKTDSLSFVTGDAHGFSLFTRYDINRGFFAWIEMEQQINKSIFQNSEQLTTPVWQKAYLLGIGREFKLGPVRMSSTILYDFNYQKNNLNPRPIVVKIGVQLSKKPE